MWILKTKTLHNIKLSVGHVCSLVRVCVCVHVCQNGEEGREKGRMGGEEEAG